MKQFIYFMVGVICLLLSSTVYADNLKGTDANIVGHVVDKDTGKHLSYITVSLKGTTIGSMTDATGHYFLKNLPEGEFTLRISAVGYKSEERQVVLKRGKTIEENFEMQEDMVALDGVVVTANRNETARRLAPTLVKVVTPKLFDMTNSHTLSQGLVFQPGVRVETDCQNCGYSQVRINGMDGKYTQILIDSRPIFSALAGVYGLEQIPANMIERVEVVRGGGSALFGSSAIAGTINIITKEPIRNSGSFSHGISRFNQSGSFDNNTMLNLSLVSSDNKIGAYIYGQNRHRSAWDSNGDGFSELPKLKNQTVGVNTYYRTSPYSKINLEYHHSEEFRRGGNRFDLPPHIAEDSNLNGSGLPGLVEQIEHSIDAGGINVSGFSRNQKHSYNFYASAQHIERKSYYSAYGLTTDFTGVLGAQYIYHWGYCLFMPSDFTAGLELNHDNLQDRAVDIQKYRDAALKEDPEATGGRLKQLIEKHTPVPLKQIVNVYSAYIQNEWKNEEWSFLLGGRIDKNSIMSKAVFSPRANIRYNPNQDVSIRLSYAEGFRAPQAFDEDLHISNVGGEQVSIVRSKSLKEERSRSLNFSVDWYHYWDDFQANLLFEGFYTKLSDPFVLTPPVNAPNGSGYLIKTRVNGSGAKVYGSTLEGKITYRDKVQLQAGITLQRSLYDSPEEWSADREHLSEKERSSRKILRTPDVYGYFTATYTPLKSLSVALNGNYTGRMYVPHLLSEVDGRADVLVNSPCFLELGAKIAYEINLSNTYLQFNLGMQNIFNSYQNDFDKGTSRDSGYIYGPGTPRSYFAGIKLSF